MFIGRRTVSDNSGSKLVRGEVSHYQGYDR
jgi:hypothetical protein